MQPLHLVALLEQGRDCPFLLQFSRALPHDGSVAVSQEMSNAAEPIRSLARIFEGCHSVSPSSVGLCESLYLPRVKKDLTTADWPYNSLAAHLPVRHSDQIHRSASTVDPWRKPPHASHSAWGVILPSTRGQS